MSTHTLAGVVVSTTPAYYPSATAGEGRHLVSWGCTQRAWAGWNRQNRVIHSSHLSPEKLIRLDLCPDHLCSMPEYPELG